MIRRLAEKVWAASRKESRIGRAVVLKLKTSNFDILTRSCTPSAPPASCEEVTNIALSLRERVGLDPGHQFSLNRRRPQQFSRFRRFSRPISSFRVTRNCASKQHSVLAESGFSTGRSDLQTHIHHHCAIRVIVASPLVPVGLVTRNQGESQFGISR